MAGVHWKYVPILARLELFRLSVLAESNEMR